MKHTQPNTHDIAIVGLSAIFPKSRNLQGYWRTLVNGTDCMEDIPPSHWLIEDYFDPNLKAPFKTYAKRGGFISPMDFDVTEFGIPPKVIPATDTAQLLGLLAARDVLIDTFGEHFKEVNKERISVILGCTGPTELVDTMSNGHQRPIWTRALREAGLPEDKVSDVCDRLESLYLPWQEDTFPGLLGNVVAGRICNRLNIGGSNYTTDAACGSSLAALSAAMDELYLDRAEMVITGGVDTLNDIFMYLCFSKTLALSFTGDCRPFSDKADGTMLGEGLGMLALKRLEDAERDGNTIYAVIKGIGSASDGYGASIYAPVAKGQARSLRRTYEAAGYGPEKVTLMESHGTGTAAGDAAEFNGLRMVFSGDGHDPSRPRCALGSVKSQIGHTKAAAGAASLIKTVLALHHRVLPPSIKVEKPNPKIDFNDNPFYINTRTRPWLHSPAEPRRASVSAFGFGGTNFHITLEEYRNPEGNVPKRFLALPSHLFLFSAKDPAGLLQGTEEALREAARGPDAFGPCAIETQAGFDPTAPARLALVAKDMGDLKTKVAQATGHLQSKPDKRLSLAGGIFYEPQPAKEQKIAFLFSGQGSHYLDMGADLAMAFPAAREIWDAGCALTPPGELALHEVVFPSPVFDPQIKKTQIGRLNLTSWTQPAIVGVSLSQLALLEKLGLQADMAAGHSLGEITALFCTGAMDLSEPLNALKVARRRGELMVLAGKNTPGAMCAVFAARDVVEMKLDAWGSTAVIANHNTPEQVALSADVPSIESLIARFSEEKIRAVRLPVSTGFHSPIVAPSCGPFRKFLGEVMVKSPDIPLYSNTTAMRYPADMDPETIRDTVANHLAHPVSFVDQVRNMHKDGAGIFVEIGPGSILTAMVGQILSERPHEAIALDAKDKQDLSGFWGGLARICLLTPKKLNFAGLWEDYRVERPPEPKKGPTVLSISGANYVPAGVNKPLPPPNPTKPAPSVPPAGAPSASPAPESPRQAMEQGTLLAIQRQLVESQRHFQDTLAHNHEHFLSTMEQTFRLMADHGLSPTDAFPSGDVVPTMAPIMTPAPSVSSQPSTAEEDPGRETAPATGTPAPSQAMDPNTVLLDVVAEKTGYPLEMLEPDMELEASLGIDSIKRVEILSTMQEKMPDLPEIELQDMAAITTLGGITDYLRAQLPSMGTQEPGAAAAVPDSPAPDGAQPAIPVAPDTDPRAILLDIVAEKTGYPLEMLEPDMELEAGLGIDSIKRLEILSAVQEQIPNLPEIEPQEIVTIQTLGEIADTLADYLSGKKTPAAGAEPASEAGASEIDTTDATDTTDTIDAGEATAETALERSEVGFVSSPASGIAPDGFHGFKEVLLSPDNRGIATALKEIMEKEGFSVTIDQMPLPETQMVLFLGGLNKRAGPPQATTIHESAFFAAKQVAKRFTRDGGIFVTVQDTGGRFCLDGPPAKPLRVWMGGLPALVKTLAQEWPKAQPKAIDLEIGERGAEDLAKAIFDELRSGGPALEVGLTESGERIIPATRQVPQPGPAASPLQEGDVVVVSGGARGIVPATLIPLAEATRCRFVLLGRTPLGEEEPEDLAKAQDDTTLKALLWQKAKADGVTVTPVAIGKEAGAVQAKREIRRTLNRLMEAGSEAVYHVVDVRDAEAMNAVLEPIREKWGPIRGIIHGAGVLADKPVAEKNASQFHNVFGTKIAGLRALLGATRDDPLRLLVFFSSIAARMGNVGQSDYAMANELLNKIAQAEARSRGPECKVLSLNWGPWEGGMVTSALKSFFQKAGVPLIPMEAGARFMTREIISGSRAVEVVVTGKSNGKGGFPIAAPRTPKMEFSVSHDTHGYLTDHSILGHVTLPAVIALEWILRAARASHPERTVVGCEDFHVTKGVRLDGFETKPVVLTIGGEERAGDEGDSLWRWGTELRSGDGRLRFRGQVLLAEDFAPLPEAPSGKTSGDWPWSMEEIYRDILFHGPNFQGIAELESCGDEGGRGTLTTLSGKGWGKNENWISDPVLFDSALQLLLLWGYRRDKRMSLPSGVKRLTLSSHRSEWPERIKCHFLCTKMTRHQAYYDITLSDDEGKTLARMEKMQATFLNPGIRLK